MGDRTPRATVARGRTRLAVSLLVAVVGVGGLLLSATPLTSPTGGSARAGNGPGPTAARAAPSEVPSSGARFAFSAPGFPLPADFFGTTVPVASTIPPNETDLLTATPARVLVWPGGGFADRYDPMTGAMYDDNGTPSGTPSNEAQFVALCRAVACRAIVEVPGEIDSPSVAAEMVRYTEGTLGFTPEYWEIGNEPGLWDHFNVSWGLWNASQSLTPNPTAYAREVAAYATAMRAVDPNLKIIGFPGDGLGASEEPNWLAAVAAIDGPVINAFGIHVYPAGLGRPGDLSTFLGTLSGNGSLPQRLPKDRAAIAAACPRCAGLPIFVTEMGSAVLDGPSTPLVEGFPNAVYLADEEVQALESNVSNTDSFAARFDNAGSWENGSFALRPDYLVYSEILGRLAGVVQPLSPSSTVGGVSAVETNASGTGGARSFLVVNTNVSTTVSIAPSDLPEFPAGPVESWSWNASSIAPVARFSATPPSSWSLPPVSLVLIEVAPAGASPVTLTPTGLPPGATWYANLGGTELAGGTGPIAFFVPNGTYALSARPAVPSPFGGRWNESIPAGLTVSGMPVAVSVSFALQYPVRLTVSPDGAGAVGSPFGWYTAGSSVPVSAVSHPHYAFSSWAGNGTGSYSGPMAAPRVQVDGPVSETAMFQFAYPVEIRTNAPPGTSWSFVVDGSNVSIAGSHGLGYFSNGSHTWTVVVPSGYRVDHTSGTFLVGGGPLNLSLSFQGASGGVNPSPPLAAIRFTDPVVAAGAALLLVAGAIALNFRRPTRADERSPEPDATTPFATGRAPAKTAPVASFVRPAAVSPEQVMVRVRVQLRRLQRLPSTDPLTTAALSEVRAVLRAVNAGRLAEASTRLDRLERIAAPARSNPPTGDTRTPREVPE